MLMSMKEEKRNYLVDKLTFYCRFKIKNGKIFLIQSTRM